MRKFIATLTLAASFFVFAASANCFVFPECPPELRQAGQLAPTCYLHTVCSRPLDARSNCEIATGVAASGWA